MLPAHRPAEPPRDEHGLPAFSARESFVARVLTGIATGVFILAASWELFGPLLAGHYASSASLGISAENMLRWRLSGPVLDYSASQPVPEDFYCHHPWGIFWTSLPLVRLFGHRDFVCRLAPWLLSAATPPLLFATGRALWRPAAGAAAAAAFVVLPITLSFATFNALEVPVIAWGLLATWGFVRFIQTWKRRYLATSTAGALLAMNADWPAFVLVGFLLGFGLLRAPLRSARGFGAIDVRRYAQWWGLWSMAALLTAGFYVLLFRHVGKFSDFLTSYTTRSRGHETSLRQVLEHRRYWIELAFTPIAIALGKIALPVILGRLVWLRREAEFVPLAWLAMATVQYVVFKQGADIHFFWPHYFAAYFALSVGALIATLIPAVEWMGRSRRALLPSRAWTLVLGLMLLPLAAIFRDGLPALAYAHGTGGRFNERGLLIDSDGDKTAFLHFIDSRMPHELIVDMHEGMRNTWAQEWALGGRVVKARQPPPKGPATDGHEIYLLDTRFASDETQAELAQRFHIEAVGPFWKIVRNEAASPVTAFSFVETEPSPFEWFFVSGTEPHREIMPDPFLTWELRTHLDQPATLPIEPPRTLDQRRIAHNMLVAGGDRAGATKLEAELAAEFRSLHTRFEGGTELVGARYQDGACPQLTLLIKAGAPLPEDVQLAVRSQVLSPARFSTTMADPVEREVAAPLAISPHRFHPGFLYLDAIPIRKRPGTEVFRAFFRTGLLGGVLPSLDGKGLIEVLRLP
jgi:hypothetical protein